MVLFGVILIILGVQGCLAEQAEQRELGPGGENEDFGSRGQPEVNVTKLLETVEAMKDEIKELKAMKDETIELKAMKDEIIELKYKLNKVESEVEEQANSTREIDENLNNHVSVLRGMSTQSMILATQSKQAAAQSMAKATQSMAKATQSMAKATQSMAKATQSINEVTSLKNKVGAGTALFSVYMTGGAFHPTYNQVFPFRGVTLNQGGHYSVSTYKFRCPRSGFYYFTYSIHSDNIRAGTSYYLSAADLVLDGNTVAQAYSYNTDPNHSMQVQGSNSAVVRCPQGGLVWIKAPQGNNRMYGTSSYRVTTFSGFLLSYL